MISKQDVEEAREILWPEFDPIPDETIELMLVSFLLIGRKAMDEMENESE